MVMNKIKYVGLTNPVVGVAYSPVLRHLDTETVIQLKLNDCVVCMVKWL